MKKDGAVLPKKIYPVKGVTVEDNQISGLWKRNQHVSY